MAKLPVKKTAAKKSAKKAAAPAKKSTAKKAAAKSPAKKAPAKKSAKAEKSEKDLLLKEANRIVASEKKKKTKRPKKTSTKEEAESLMDSIIEGMQEKKAKNITVIDLQELENRVCDVFVICDAESTTHVDAIADSVEEVVKKKTGERPYHSEGYDNSEWILLDYINIVVHVFQREIREYYNIEALWADGVVTNIE